MKLNATILLSAMIIAGTCTAQDLKVNCQVYTEDGSNDDITLMVDRLDGQQSWTYTDVGSHRLNLEVDQDYVLTYKKDGYVTKSIIVATPKQIFKKKKIDFEVKLEAQTENAFVELYDSPVAYVSFDRNNNMKYETRYSKQYSMELYAQDQE